MNTEKHIPDTSTTKELAALKHVVLSAREKAETRSALEAFMEFHPISPQAPVRSPLSFLRMAVNTPFLHPLPFVALLLILVVTTSTAAAAEGALPGDFLYPIKVHVNEEVRSALTFDTSKRADWEIERAERRIEEATQLAVEDRLPDETREELAQQVETHVSTALALVTPSDTARLEASEQGVAEMHTQSDIQPSHDKNQDVYERIVSRAHAARLARDHIVRVPLALAPDTRTAAPTVAAVVELESAADARAKTVSVSVNVLPTPSDPTTDTEPPMAMMMAAEIEPTDVTQEKTTEASLAGSLATLEKRLETSEKTIAYAESRLGTEALAPVRALLVSALDEKERGTKIADTNPTEAAEAYTRATEISFEVLDAVQTALHLGKTEESVDATSTVEVDAHTSTSTESENGNSLLPDINVDVRL